MLPHLRDILFISHANPEDNEFSLWLALRLASEGYAVWCDLTELLGGEDFWKDIEDKLRDRTVKVLYVLSKTSNSKDGPRKELHLAAGVAKSNGFKDFIIPLHIDDLPHSDVNIQLNNLNSISFEAGWAGGLSKLLKKLNKSRVPKSESFGPRAVAAWWRNQFSSETGLVREPETLVSNWFPILRLPKKLYVHAFQPGISFENYTTNQKPVYPVREFSKGLVSFANRNDLPNSDQVFWHSQSYDLSDLLANKYAATFVGTKEARLVLVDLFRQAWENKLKERNLRLYELASGAQCGYFVRDVIESEMMGFDIGIIRGRRQVIGFKTMDKETGRKRHWHFGVSGRFFFRSSNYLVVNPHVVFSDNGQDIWKSKERIHKAKMRQCSNWWNDQWRDRILSVVEYLADDGLVKLTLGSGSILEVDKKPMQFRSPVLFHDPIKTDGSQVSNEDDDEVEEYEDPDDIA